MTGWQKMRTGEAIPPGPLRLGQSDLDEVTQTPTEAADNEAVEYFEELSRNRQQLTSFDREVNVFTEKMRLQLLEWTADRSLLPRIFIMGDIEPACQMMEESVGFRYSMEHWVHRMLTSSDSILVSNVEAADFVFLPHCATGVFMHMVVQDEQRQKGGIGHAASLSQLNASAWKRGRQIFLGYEGNLPASTVLRLDKTYLMHKVNVVWKDVPAFSHCWRRKSCKFLTASIYGRHVWRQFASTFGSKAVFITHAGMSDWLRNQPEELFSGESDFAAHASSCGASCELHCMMDPAPVLPQDIVLPWVVAFEWTSRAISFHQRDILVFYSGTENSCSRKRIREVFAGTFEHEMAKESNARKDRVLIFPPEFRLKQKEWSELAYRSKLCLCPDGDSPNTGRLIEVMMHGCVPLIISNRLQPPFHEYFDWSRIAFFLREDAIPRLPQILAYLQGPQGRGQIAQKRHLLKQMGFLCDYARDGVGSTMLMALRERAKELRAI
ncbi:unnamed protein product [Effrenium voratum]|uniref:Exostosin GT47 domain-containing protein n=1 Tax=Effrenium voratum TaxID=2562239 RepID=A0AA36J680_9DINO|nr:unnamed protein product [Effrenium voratum]